MDERVELLRSIKSQRIVVPDLRSIFLDWPGIYNDSINQHYGALTEMVNKRLEGLYTNADMLRKLKDADFAYFTSLWWPQAPFEELQVLAFLVIWLFTWDDEIDEPTGAVADDFDAAQRYREETSNFVELCLGLAVQAHNSAPRNLIVRSFRDIADGLCAFYNLKQRRRFLEEISRFMEMSQREQEFKLSGTLPSLAEYWEFRLGTSAVYVGLAAMEYSNRSSLSDAAMESLEMKTIWHETNIIISITNDLLSLKKEIRQGCVDSIVPLTFTKRRDINSCIAGAVSQLQNSKKRFEEAADSMSASGEAPEVSRFIEGCKSNCVGNLIWSLTTSRYGVSEVSEMFAYL